MMLKTLETITRWFSRALMLAGALGLLAMTAAIGWQVFGRYVLNATPVWTEVTAVIIMGWFIFLGAAVGIREGYHLSFDILLYVLPRQMDSLHPGAEGSPTFGATDLAPAMRIVFYPAVIGFIAHGSSLSTAFVLIAVLLIGVAISGKILRV
jgi:hypothetical protein